MLHLPSISGFTFHRKIGGGSVCEVFEASKNKKINDKKFAVKIVKSRKIDGQDDYPLTLIQREASVGLEVQHPNIVQFHDVHVEEPPYFVVMELLSGETVKQRLSRTVLPSLNVVLGIARQIAEGLSGLHAAGWIHGDIKPANIMITSPGKVKIIDLGFAHESGEFLPMIKSGKVLGTANYIAPELTIIPENESSNRNIDTTQTDIFSLGVVLFELLTGRLPYPGKTTSEVINCRRICESAKLTGNWPGDLVKLVSSLTQFEPDQRPRANEVVRKLTELQIEMFQFQYKAA